MPRLPDFGSVTPARGGGRVVPVQADQTGVGLQQMGETLYRVNAERQERDARTSYSKARAQFAIEQTKMLSELQRDTDYRSFETKYEGMRRRISELGSGVTDPAYRAQFEQDAELDYTQGMARVQGLAWDREVDHENAALDKDLTVLHEAFLTEKDSAARARHLENARTRILAAQENGYLDETRAQEKSQRFAVNAAASYIDMQEPGEQLKLLGDANGVAQYIPADVRHSMAEKAKNKLEAERHKFSITLGQDIQDAEAMARTGVAPVGPARTRGEFAAAYEDPRVAERQYARYATARQTAMEMPGLIGKSSAELIAITQAKPEANDPNFAVTAEAQSIKANAATSILRARAADPVGYALQAQDFGFQPLNPSDQQAFGDELSRRVAALPAMGEKYGTAGLLAKPEAEQLARSLDQLPADEKVAQLETISRTVTDPDAYGAVMNAIRPDSPVTALVGNIAAAGNRDAARQIARGEDLLNPTKGKKGADGKGGFPLPTEQYMHDAWVARVGDAYRGYPDAENAAYQAFRAHYAATAADKGLNNPASGVDTDTADTAFQASTGGVMQWDTNWHPFGTTTQESSIVLPYGMAEDVFLNRVTLQWEEMRAKAGYPTTDIHDVGLYNTGANGEYVLMSGDSWLPGKDGKPILLRVQ